MSLKCTGGFVSCQWRMIQNLKRNWLVRSKLTWEIWQILTQALENLKNLHFNGLLLTKVYNVGAKNVQGSYFWWHWIFMQNLWKTDFCFQKWHEEFGKCSPEHLKVSKFGLWWDSFIQSRKCVSLKLTRELIVMAMKKDAKLEEELTCCFKVDNFDEFWPEHSKISKICTLMGCVGPKYVMFELKNSIEELCLMALKIDAKFKGKLTCAF